MTPFAAAIVTAYCHCSTCCGESGKPTASGRMPVVGVTIAAPRSIPFGTRVAIRLPEGWRTFTVQDRTARRYDGRFDVFLHDHRSAMRFGVKRTEVRLLGPGVVLR